MAKKQRQPTLPPPQLTPLTPSAPPIPIEPQPTKPLKVEPNPFLTDTSHLPEIHEVKEEEIDEELEGLTLKQLEECEVPMWCNSCSAWHALGTAKTVTRVP